jgi:NAD(P)-dependent dehydrogenase (short-subunit alcohol dehydrogenase family)
MDRFDLSGRTALVTGGSRGIGRAAAQALAEARADVIVASRDEASCRRAADEISAAAGQRAFAHACHVGHWSELDRLAEAAWRYTGRLDILVNNAGMSPLYDRVTDVTEELFDKVIGVNLKGPFRLTALIGSRMAEQAGGGSIINVSSVGGVRPQPDAIPYSAAKAGLNAMTVAFAHLLGPAVRVNAVVPGRFLTDVSKHWDPEALRAANALTALRRAGAADEMAGAIVYLASDAASYTSGTLLRVDGGWQP